jgi:hypothetical protein
MTASVSGDRSPFQHKMGGNHMTSIRIVLASLLAAGTVLAGGALAQHSGAASVSHKIIVASPVPCCEATITR